MCLYYRATNQLQNKFQRSSVTVKSKKKKKKITMKRKRFAFWICRRQACQKNPPSQNTIHSHLQNYPKLCDHSIPFPYNRHEWIIPYIKTYCYTQIWKGFWENLKGYHYTIRKSITWTFSVVTFRVYFCVTCRFYLCT